MRKRRSGELLISEAFQISLGFCSGIDGLFIDGFGRMLAEGRGPAMGETSATNAKRSTSWSRVNSLNYSAGLLNEAALSNQYFILSNASLAAYVHVHDVFFANGGPRTSGKSLAANAMQATAEGLEKILVHSEGSR